MVNGPFHKTEGFLSSKTSGSPSLGFTNDIGPLSINIPPISTTSPLPDVYGPIESELAEVEHILKTELRERDADGQAAKA